MEAIEKIDFEKVGKRMKKLRKEQRISQDQVAKDLGATISFVSNIENNYTKINLRVLLYYAQMCHVSVDYLLSAGNPRCQSRQYFYISEDILRVLRITIKRKRTYLENVKNRQRSGSGCQRLNFFFSNYSGPNRAPLHI